MLPLLILAAALPSPTGVRIEARATATVLSGVRAGEARTQPNLAALRPIVRTRGCTPRCRLIVMDMP